LSRESTALGILSVHGIIVASQECVGHGNVVLVVTEVAIALQAEGIRGVWLDLPDADAIRGIHDVGDRVAAAGVVGQAERRLLLRQSPRQLLASARP
jgi:hypothetical protein